VLAHDWFDGLGCLVSVVEGDGGDVVVKDMGLNDAVKKGTANEAKFAVDGRSGATDVIPTGSGVVRKGWVGVLEECDSNEPVVDPEVRDEVPNSHVGEAELLDQEVKSRDNDGKTGIAQEN